MAEHSASPPDQATESAAEAPPTRTRDTTHRSRPSFPRRGWRRVAHAIATAAVAAAATIAIIMAVHIVFVVFEANTANGIVTTVDDWAQTLAWKFKDVFTPADPKTAALVNYGLTAILYLIAGRVVANLIRRST